MASETPGIVNSTGTTWSDNADSCPGITLPKTIKPYSRNEANPITVDVSKWDKQVCTVTYYDQYGNTAMISIVQDGSTIGWQVQGSDMAETRPGNVIEIVSKK